MPSTALTVPSSVSKWTARSLISSSAMWSVPDPWIEEGIHDVHEQVHHDDRKRADQHRALDDRQVALLDGVEGEPAHARDVEHGLGQDRAAKQDAQVEAEDGHDRRDRGAQPVLE